jgi:hypothetical protein
LSTSKLSPSELFRVIFLVDDIMMIRFWFQYCSSISPFFKRWNS